MRPADKLLSDLDLWEARTGGQPAVRRLEALTALLGRSLRGLPAGIVSGIAYRWSVLAQEPGGAARSWLDTASQLALGDFRDDINLSREDWNEIRELFSSEADNLDMDLLSYILERVLDHGGF